VYLKNTINQPILQILCLNGMHNFFVCLVKQEIIVQCAVKRKIPSEVVKSDGDYRRNRDNNQHQIE
jgi:hypothetical protein